MWWLLMVSGWLIAAGLASYIAVHRHRQRALARWAMSKIDDFLAMKSNWLFDSRDEDTLCEFVEELGFKEVSEKYLNSVHN